MDNEKLPTAEDIVESYPVFTEFYGKVVLVLSAASAARDYARLRMGPLEKEIEKLKVYRDKFNAQLDKKTPYEAWAAANQHCVNLEKQIENDQLTRQNQKLREALERIANTHSESPDTDGLIEIAVEALNGQ